MTEAWPMYVARAFAFTPAAIIRLAKVCRASWSVIGSRPAAPGRLGSSVDRGTVEWLSVCAAEDVAEGAGAAVSVLDEVVAQDRRNRDSAARRTGLRLDRAFLHVPRSFDADNAVREFDVVPAKRLELATTKAAVQGGRPKRPVVLRKRGEERVGLLGRDDAIARAAYGGKLKAARRIDGDVAVGERTPKRSRGGA